MSSGKGPRTVMQSARGSYVRTGCGVNIPAFVRALEAGFFSAAELVKKWTSRRTGRGAGSVRTGTGQRAVLGLEVLLDGGEDVQGAVDRRVVVRRHHARAQQRSAGRYGGVQRGGHEHAGGGGGLPQNRRLPCGRHPR